MIATRVETTDRDLVEAVRDGDDSAFEELYRRYNDRIAAYVRRMVRDPARAEDLAQDAFFSALRRMRATDAEIAFKPWIFEIARNATIDHWRRTSRAEEISVEADDQLRPSDRGRLVGSSGPDAALVNKERLDHLRGAFDELSDVHTRILVMRELEGLSYREIAEKLDLTRASVESALFRARRRLESEYADISEGRRCAAMRTVMARLAEGLTNKRDEGRLARHARRCHVCRRRARELGVEPLAPLSGIRGKAAAFLPLPFFARRGGDGLSGLLPTGAQVGSAVAERAVALVAAAAIAGAGGMALGGDSPISGSRDGANGPAAEERTPAAQPAGTGQEARERSEAAAGAAAGDESPAGESATGPADAPGFSESSSPQDEAAAGAQPGDVALPALPAVPAEDGSGSTGRDGPRLPAPPSFEPPPGPSFDVPQGAPRVEVPQATPVEVPALPEPPAVETGVDLDAVTGATGAAG